MAQKLSRRQKIKFSIRKKLSGTAERPRLSVFRSNRAIYAQIIDDNQATTLVSASTLDIDNNLKSTNLEIATQVGKKLAQKAAEKGIQTVVFDRNGYLYHGKVKALAEGAREGGLKF